MTTYGGQHVHAYLRRNGSPVVAPEVPTPPPERNQWLLTGLEAINLAARASRRRAVWRGRLGLFSRAWLRWTALGAVFGISLTGGYLIAEPLLTATSESFTTQTNYPGVTLSLDEDDSPLAGSVASWTITADLDGETPYELLNFKMDLTGTTASELVCTVSQNLSVGNDVSDAACTTQNLLGVEDLEFSISQPENVLVRTGGAVTATLTIDKRP